MTFVMRGTATFLVIACASAAHAQIAPVTRTWLARPTTDPVAAHADSLTAAGDSTRAMAYLESVLFPHSKNAAAWNRYGLLKWRSVAATRRGGYINDAKTITALRLADSALRLATKFAPDSAEYWVALGRFNLQSDVATMRFAASRQMQDAFNAATKTGDSAYVALSADEVGLATWRRYETTANRAMVGAGQHVQLQTDGRFRRAQAKDYLATFAKKIEPPTGRADLIVALSRFQTASAAAASNLRYSRHVFMALAESQRWDELLSFATKRATASPFDAQARFARGLALQRLGRTVSAAAVFDSAMTMLDDGDRDYLFRLDRILSPGPSAWTGKRDMGASAMAAMSPAQRAATGALYWSVNDPLIATEASESEVEFIARVVQAELTWTDDELGIRGVDSDRGDIFIRYGPPAEQMTINGISSVQQATFATTGAEVMSTSQDVGATLAWIYKSGDVFFFDMAPGFGTARTSLTDQQYVRDYASTKPVTWDNLDVPHRVDSLEIRTTRFRATKDSTDVVIATTLPVRRLVKDIEVDEIDVQIDMRVFDSAARARGIDSSRVRIGADSSAPNAINAIARSWVRRVGAGGNVVRVEALQRESRRAASSLVAVLPDATSGFGLSDVLLVAVKGASTTTTAARWRDLGVTPSSGDYRVGEKIGLAWEAYELAALAGANSYRVAITVERVKRSGAAGLALRLLDQVGGLLRQGSAPSERLSLTFDRNTPARATQVEYLTLDWIGDARGEYRLRVEVTDLNGKQTGARETRFRIQ